MHSYQLNSDEKLKMTFFISNKVLRYLNIYLIDRVQQKNVSGNNARIDVSVKITSE